MYITRNKIIVMLNLFVTHKKVNQWFEKKNVFFILGLGRSGTAFFADLLNNAENAVVLHEPIAEDFQEFVIAHKSDYSALNYIEKYRKKMIYVLLKKKYFNIYGEVNSVLRYHAKALKISFPNAKLLHLVRDGRDVVRSFMARSHYKENARGHHALVPLKEDPLYNQWHSLNRFEKICWLWSDANSKVAQSVDRFVKFEKLISDYSYFNKNIECFLEINIGKKKWSEAVSKPKNTTKKHDMPHWRDWTPSFMESFKKICNKEMNKFGYF